MKTLTAAERFDLVARAKPIAERARLNFWTALVGINLVTLFVVQLLLPGWLLIVECYLALFVVGFLAYFLSKWRYAFFLIPATEVGAAIALGIDSGPHVKVASVFGLIFLISGVSSLGTAVVYARANDKSLDNERLQILEWCRDLQTFPRLRHLDVSSFDPAVHSGILLSTSKFWNMECWLFRNGDWLLVAHRFRGKRWLLRVFDARTVKVEEDTAKRQLRFDHLMIRNVDFTLQLKSSLTEVLA